MTLREIAKLPPGTKVYEIRNGNIDSFQILAFDSRDSNYFYLISGYDHSKAIGYYLPTERGVWHSDYEEAKEVMWIQSIEKLKVKNEIYFENKKNLEDYDKT